MEWFLSHHPHAPLPPPEKNPQYSTNVSDHNEQGLFTKQLASCNFCHWGSSRSHNCNHFLTKEEIVKTFIIAGFLGVAFKINVFIKIKRRVIK